ncbi:MAG: SH3 domain-containing protein [Lachnospiraceae bacterium]|nr:SH3 domain-containing protein [Lachnospiraceae bacterium]
MKTITKNNWIRKACMGIFSLVMVCMLCLTVEQLSMVSYAQSAGKVTGDNVNIRKEPNSSSQKVGSAKKDASVTINHQTQGSDGKVWYQIYVDANTLGYIRSDFVSITDGSTPETVDASAATSNNQTTTQTNTQPAGSSSETAVNVTAVEPISATVTGGENVRVRGNASTTSQIVTTIANGSALTVTGQANGSDGKVWYQVAFISNGSDVTGFIRSDYVVLSGDIVEATQTPEETAPEESTEPEQAPEPEETKAWETQLQGDEWFLLNMDEGYQYSIENMFNASKQNGEAFEESQKTVKTQKLVIVILVIVIIVLCAGLALLIFKINDMKDSAYFAEVEKDTMRKRGSEKNQSDKKVMQNVGPEKRNGSGAQGNRPQGGRPQPQGGRPQGMQSQGGRPQGTRPQNGLQMGGRPVNDRPGTRPVQPVGSRPVAEEPVVERPVTERPVTEKRRMERPAIDKAASDRVSTRPIGERPSGVRPEAVRPESDRVVQPGGGRQVGERPVGVRPSAQNQGQVNPNKKSKNFASDDDEFEFEFLNWDGEE